MSEYPTYPSHLCQDCNGACCKIFLLNYTRGDIIRKLLFNTGKLAPNKEATFWEAFKQFLFLRDVTTQFTKPLEHYERAYTCLALKDGKCSIYNHRHVFCKHYWCYGSAQFANQMPLDGQPPLPRGNDFDQQDAEVKQALEFGKEFAKSL